MPVVKKKRLLTVEFELYFELVLFSYLVEQLYKSEILLK